MGELTTMMQDHNAEDDGLRVDVSLGAIRRAHNKRVVLEAEVERLREWQRSAVVLLTGCECHDPASVMGDQMALLLRAARPEAVS